MKYLFVQLKLKYYTNEYLIRTSFYIAWKIIVIELKNLCLLNAMK